jgi:hypothetical protein
MGKWCPKHVEALRFNKAVVNVKCIKLVRVITLASSYLSAPLSVCPSVRMEHLGFQRKDFYKLRYLSIFRKSVQNIQVSSKYDKNTRYITRREINIFYHISLVSSPKHTFRTKVVETIKIHTLCLISRKSCRLWDNVETFCTVRQTTD